MMRLHQVKSCAILFGPAVLLAGSALAQAPHSPNPKPVNGPIRATTVAKGLNHPWGLAFLPDGRMLVSERVGRLRIATPDGKLSQPLGGLPQPLARGQGGYLDVALSPNFKEDQLVYLAFSELGEGGAGTAVLRGKLGETAIENAKVIWQQTPKADGNNHWGSRLVFAQDGTLYVTTGDRYALRERAQDLSTTVGKVIRINADGSVPKDNPLVGREGARPEIWSYGHRNLQGAALHPETGQLWTLEHGARGGDELNYPQPGRNYGWPVITYGIDYSGARIGEGTAKQGMEQPVYYWDPVIAPSGALFYTGDVFADWKGDLFVGSMNPGALVRLEMNGNKVTSETRYDFDERIRDVVQGPDGLIYLLTDSSRGRILRVEPAQSRTSRSTRSSAPAG